MTKIRFEQHENLFLLVVSKSLGCKTDECDEYHESKKSNGLLQQNKCRLDFVFFSED